VAVVKLEPFALERLQSTFEHHVDFNLSESGVQPLTLGELIEDAASREALMAEALRYTQTNGTQPLRESIAALYPGATADHVLVTNGGAEANYITTWNLAQPGDEVVMMVPNFMQTWGLARAFGANLTAWPLIAPDADGPSRAEAARGEGGWRVDLDGLERLTSARTRLIAICNPNNPTGARFEAGDLDRVAAIADRHGSWLVSDEIYRGAERDGRETPTAWGRSDRVIVTSGLSKAYGLPGLRIGWIVAPPAFTQETWARHDYTTIGPSGASDHLAAVALDPRVREKLIDRTRRILNANYPVMEAWLKGFGDTFTWHAPQAGAICWARYKQAIPAAEIVEKVRAQHSVLLVPGDHFGMPAFLRFGFGGELQHLQEALAETERALRRLFTD